MEAPYHARDDSGVFPVSAGGVSIRGMMPVIRFQLKTASTAPVGSAEGVRGWDTLDVRAARQTSDVSAPANQPLNTRVSSQRAFESAHGSQAS
jgi:hypothetical protein